MNIEQERARFKAHYEGLFDLTETTDGWCQPKFTHEHIESIWAGWKARASLQSQDREDAERFRFCLEHGFPQKWEEMIKGNLRHYWTSRPGSQEEFSSAIEAIDHARRVGGES